MHSRKSHTPGAIASACKLPGGPDEFHTLGPDAATLATLARLIPEHGDLFCIRSRDRRDPSYVVSNPAHIRQILLTNHTNYAKGVGFERVKMLLGNGIIVSDGEEWRRQRTMMQPGFSRANIARLAEPMRLQNLRLRTEWGAIADSPQTLDVKSAMSHLGLEVILRAIFSTDLDRMIERHGENPFGFLAEDPTRDLQTAVRFRNLAKTTLACIHDRRNTGNRPFDFLSMMMDATDKKSGAGMSDKELLDEINTLIIAGHETSAGTLNWAWFLLAGHPAVEERMLDELRRAIPEQFTFDQLMGLEYTANVLKETLRLYPPVWLFSRRALAADKLGEFDVPAGTHLFIAPYLLHRRPELWPDPERFDPDRFDEAISPPVDRFAFIPFSAGARRCIGEYFSFVEMQMHLAILAPHYQLRRTGQEPVELEPAVNLRTRFPLHMSVHRRPPPGPKP